MAKREPNNTFLWQPILTLSCWGKHRITKTSRLLQITNSQNQFLFSYGRVALLEGVRMLKLHEGSNVLLPAYICQSGIDPFLELGIEVRFYEVTRALEPNMPHLENLIDENTRAIMAVNYFGFPAPGLAEIVNICKQRDLLLIEDNAHGFLSHIKNRPLGTFGDIGISSIWKFLPIPEGALLCVNNDKLIQDKTSIAELQARQQNYPEISRPPYYRYFVFSVLNELEQRYGISFLKILSFVNHRFGKQASQEKSTDKWKVRMSKVSIQIAKNLDLDMIFRIRRQNSSVWYEYVAQRSNLEIVFKEMNGICPFYMPIIAEDAEAFTSTMASKGIPVYLWPPNLYDKLQGNPIYPVTNYLSKHLFTVPAHQCISPRKLKEILGK
jgi:dTDP-4-amino-4,6-dideoxygalactose transaminase